MSKLSRREFIGRTLAASASIPWCAGSALSGLAAETFSPPIVVFSKVYQTLKLNFEEAAAVTAEAGIDGIDCPVRPGGEVLPEHVTGELPQYAWALRKRGLQMPLLTTAITSVASPHTVEILRTAKKLGVKFYRLGFIIRGRNVSARKQEREFKAK